MKRLVKLLFFVSFIFIIITINKSIKASSFDKSYINNEIAQSYKNEKSNYKNGGIAIICTVYGGLGFVFFTAIAAIVIDKKAKKLIIRDKDKNCLKEEMYYREIPCDYNLFRTYYIAYSYGIISKKTNIIGALILRWLKNGLIRIEQKEKGMILKKENMIIVLNEINSERIFDIHEKELFNMLYDASKDGIMENKEFERWCTHGYDHITGWFDAIIREQQKLLVEEGLIKVEKKYIGISKSYIPTLDLNEEAKKINGLKKYLLDYTLIPDRQVMEVHLFEDYLIYAQLLGIAEKVTNEFKDIYPNIIGQTMFLSYDNLLYILFN